MDVWEIGMFYRIRIGIADLMDILDDRALGHRFYWLCKFISFRLYPDDWCSKHGRCQGDWCPECIEYRKLKDEK